MSGYTVFVKRHSGKCQPSQNGPAEEGSLECAGCGMHLIAQIKCLNHVKIQAVHQENN